MDDTLSITTPENIELSYDLAGIGSRFIALLIDTLIQAVIEIGILIGVFILLSVVPWADLGVDYQTRDTITSAALAVILLFLFALIWGYFILFETIWNGQTPGKRLVRLRVIKDNGYPITVLDAVIRNLVRIIDFLPSSYSIGVTVMFLNRQSRRLGDFAAGTLVVKEREYIDLRSLSGIAPRGVPYQPSPIKMKALVKKQEKEDAPDRPLPTGTEDDEITLPPVGVVLPNLERLTHDDYTVIREYLHRRTEFEGWRSQELGKRLAAAIARKLDYEIPTSFISTTGFLEQVMRESQGVRGAS